MNKLLILACMVLAACKPTREEITTMRLQCAKKGMGTAYVMSDPPTQGVVMKVYCRDSDGAWYEPEASK